MTTVAELEEQARETNKRLEELREQDRLKKEEEAERLRKEKEELERGGVKGGKRAARSVQEEGPSRKKSGAQGGATQKDKVKHWEQEFSDCRRVVREAHGTAVTRNIRVPRAFKSWDIRTLSVREWEALGALEKIVSPCWTGLRGLFVQQGLQRKQGQVSLEPVFNLADLTVSDDFVEEMEAKNKDKVGWCCAYAEVL
jgi:hypothetical protein